MAMKQAVFGIGSEKYGINIMDVSIIEKHIADEKTTNATKNVKGLIRLRGDVIPVYSLRRKFGLEDQEPGTDTRLIITKSNGFTVAYEVDKMFGIFNVEDNQIFDTPSIVYSKDTSYIKKVTNLDNSLVILMDKDGILSEDEQESIKLILQKENANN